MRFEWDASKSEENLRRRGFDFAFATLTFDSWYVEYDDDRRAYGERRTIVLGVADGIPLTVVYTDRRAADGGLVRRLISARVSNRKERRRYVKEFEAASRQVPDSGTG